MRAHRWRAKGESPSNGVAEGAGETVRAFAKVLKYQLEQKDTLKVLGNKVSKGGESKPMFEHRCLVADIALGKSMAEFRKPGLTRSPEELCALRHRCSLWSL